MPDNASAPADLRVHFGQVGVAGSRARFWGLEVDCSIYQFKISTYQKGEQKRQTFSTSEVSDSEAREGTELEALTGGAAVG